jgi:hypothetical protein
MEHGESELPFSWIGNDVFLTFLLDSAVMIIIRFADSATERQALGYLAGRFSFRAWANGEMMVPAESLAYLALEGFSFMVVGPATYEQLVPPLRLSTFRSA